MRVRQRERDLNICTLSQRNKYKGMQIPMKAKEEAETGTLAQCHKGKDKDRDK